MERSPGSVSWVVFDLGEVLSQSPPHLASLAGALGAQVAPFERAYWLHRDIYDAGGGADQYWELVAAEVNRPMPAVLAEQLSEEDLSAWVVLHRDSLGLLEELAARQVKVGLLSNAPKEMAERVRLQHWAGLFDLLVFSAEIGVNKPDRRAYEATAAATGVAPAEIGFFDDRPVNVAGARSAGWNAQLWQGHAGARAVLAAWGVL